MSKRYPRTLSQGAHNVVIAISETEVGKLFHGDSRSDIGSEARKMKYANGVNDLVVKLRLIDVGISAIKEEVGEKLFTRFVERELEEL